MAICIKCGKESESLLCNECAKDTNLEELCFQILEYTPGNGENEIWDQISMGLSSKYNFKNIIFAISDTLTFPRKDYMRLLCLSGGYEYVSKNSREWLYSIYKQIIDSDKLSENEKNRVRGLVMSAYVMDYRYAEADEMASALMTYDELPCYCYYTLADFYTKTRRYMEAEEVLTEAMEYYKNSPQVLNKLQTFWKENSKRKGSPENGCKEYLPAAKDAREIYTKFLETLGIEILTSKRSKRKAIPKDQYPDPIETRELDFDSFVAFDVETTGFSAKIDSIIEIGAIKVVNGELVESKEFVFQELVKPYKKSVSAEITKLTGITADDVKDARQMWDVIPDFLDFAGDSILVGYNSIKFDSQFLARAGRYSNRIITNKHFDVMRFIERNAEQIGLEMQDFKLSTVCEHFGIENPEVHRALSDAIVTAKVLLKLKEIGGSTEEVSLDDLLSDLDEW